MSVLRGYVKLTLPAVFTAPFARAECVAIEQWYRADGWVLLWDWKRGACVGSSRPQQTIHAVSFVQSGASFWTFGERHLRVWTVPSIDSTSNDQTQKVCPLAQERQAGVR